MQNVDYPNTIPPEKEGFNHDHIGIGGNARPLGAKNPPPQLLSSTQDCDSQGGEGIGEEVLASDPVDGVSGDLPPSKKARFNGSQGKHWIFTFNNYTDDDCLKITTAFDRAEKEGKPCRLVSAIIGKEVGPDYRREEKLFAHE